MEFPSGLVTLQTEVIYELNLINRTLETTPKISQPTVFHRNISRQIRFFLLAIIIPVGMLFNFLSCAVFLRSRMRKSTTVTYFFALACADNIVLLGELLLWLTMYTDLGSITGARFVDEIDSMCKFVHFLRYFGRLFSSWLVVAICIERYIKVAHPLKSSTYSTVSKARVIIVSLVIVCLVLACPAFFTVGTYPRNGTLYCKIVGVYRTAYDHWVVFVMIFGELVIPGIIVTIFTTLIIIKLAQAKRQRTFSKEGQDRSNRSRSDMQPTIALLAVSIAFVTLRMPYAFSYPLYMKRKVVFGDLSHWQTLELKVAYDVSFLLAVTNYAINFLLYIVTGKIFRKEFARFLLCKGSRLAPTWSRSYSMTSQTTSLRRFSNSDIHHNAVNLKSQTPDDKKASSNNGTNNHKYTPVRQDSQL